MRSYGDTVGCGIELDWLEEREEQIEAFIAGRGFDLVLGSVHWLGGLAVDHPDYAIWEEMPADEVWRRYFAQVRAAAASGASTCSRTSISRRCSGTRRASP